MSSQSVGKWEVFAEAMETAPEGRKWPTVECAEDLVWATKVVRQRFQRSAANLTRYGKKANPFDKQKYGQPVWYRGEAMREIGRALCPSVFRCKFYHKSVKGHRSAEKWMITEFWRKAVLRGVQCPAPGDGLAWLALAQHHGLPTRLLDWTESILVAAWFAVGEQEDCARRVQECPSARKTETVIWALSPSLMNWRLNKGGPFFFPKADDPIVDDAFSGKSRSEGKVYAIWQQSVHARMVSQNAYFTIHGSENSLIDLNTGNCQPGPRFLYKLTISPQARESIRQDLLALGVSKSTIYPGLDSLCVDVSERWKEIVQRIRSGQSP